MKLTIKDLKPGTSYVIKGRSISSEETSDWSIGLFITTPGDSGVALPGGSLGGSYYGLVYVQPNEPQNVPIGTLWFDTDDFSV